MAVTENEGGIETAYVLTPSYDRTYHANVEYPAKYVRVRVRNLSHLTAKNCLCELIKIETLDDGSFKKAPLFDSPRLAWNFEWDNAPPDQRRDISPQGALFADVLFTYNNKGSQGVFLRALAFNRHFREFIRLNNSYRVTIRLSADNRKSQELCLKFVFSKTWDSFEVAVE